MNFYIIQDLLHGGCKTVPTAEARFYAILNQQMDDCAYNIFRIGGSMVHLIYSEIV